jgi:hypothetical protein
LLQYTISNIGKFCSFIKASFYALKETIMLVCAHKIVFVVNPPNGG